jgi:cytochrome oxidase Cu insertion factor (SCO1/SenC/PrrC family)
LKKFDWTDKHQKLSNDPSFVIKFEVFLKKLITKVRNPDEKFIKVDEIIYHFIENYIIQKRKKNINKILRKKDI